MVNFFEIFPIKMCTSIILNCLVCFAYFEFEEYLLVILMAIMYPVEEIVMIVEWN